MDSSTGSGQENETGKDPRQYRHYNPVEVHIQPEETLGAIFLGVLSMILLVAFLRAQKKIRTLQAQLGGLDDA